MNCKIRLAATALFASTLAVMTPRLAVAQDNCDLYAELALQQQQQNLERGCGFVGPEWNDDLDRHRWWCRQSAPTLWRSELQRRDEMLKLQCNK